jgi:hypothetical protein
MIDKLKQLLAPNVEVAAKLAAVSMFLGKMIVKQDDRIVSLEARQLQKGDKGDKGDSIVGPKGDKGDVGPAGKSIVGPAGKDGKDGKQGKAGKDGVSVVSSEIAADGHLVFTLSNGKIIDAGEIEQLGSQFAVYSKQVAKDQITVSAIAPQSPQVNDLWLDIS